MSDLIDRFMAGRLTEADRRTLVEHGRREGDRLPVGDDPRFTEAELRENAEGRVESMAEWAALLFDQGRKSEDEIAAILRDSRSAEIPDAEREVEAAMRKAKRRKRRKRSRRPPEEEEAVVGRADAGTSGDVDPPDADVGEGEIDDDDEIAADEERWARSRAAEERLGISHEALVEEMLRPC
jgi:hypothetical protein